MTLAALVPPCALLLARPSRLGFLQCAVTCGLAFFLCSFQVHEKHILLPLLPASLLSAHQPTLFAWLALVATFSLYPLLERDGQALPYALCQLGFLALTLALDESLAPSLSATATATAANTDGEDEPSSPLPADFGGVEPIEAATAAATLAAPPPLPLPFTARVAMAASLLSMLLLHLAKAIVSPPPRYPDLHSVAFAAFSCVHFVVAYVAVLVWQWRGRNAEHTHTPFDGQEAAPFLFGSLAVKARAKME